MDIPEVPSLSSGAKIALQERLFKTHLLKEKIKILND